MTPTYTFDAGRIETLVGRAREVLEANRRLTNGFQYTVPSPSTYPYQWFWDSCFHAIVLAHFSPEDAKQELRSLLSKRFDNGMIPHMIYWQRGPLIDIDWGKGDTSSITQPPIIAEAVWKIFEKTGDEDFLREVYTHLFHYYNYLLTERDPRGHHLAGIINPDESGEDNSPRFDAAVGLPPQHTLRESLERRIELVNDLRACNFDAPFCMRDHFWVKDVPFNAIFTHNLDVLANISERIGNLDEAAIYRDHSSKVAASMREHFFEDGAFWSATGKDLAKIKVRTWALFAPLYAGLYSPDEARVLVDEHLLDQKQFRTQYLVPTVSIDEPSFDAGGFWRGPTWIATNWFVFRGLLRYGRIDVALRLLESSMQLLEKSGFREYFNPHTGEGLGAEQFTWGALIVDMFDASRRAGLIA